MFALPVLLDFGLSHLNFGLAKKLTSTNMWKWEWCGKRLFAIYLFSGPLLCALQRSLGALRVRDRDQELFQQGGAPASWEVIQSRSPLWSSSWPGSWSVSRSSLQREKHRQPGEGTEHQQGAQCGEGEQVRDTQYWPTIGEFSELSNQS